MNTYFKIEKHDLQSHDWHTFTEIATGKSVDVFRFTRLFRSSFAEISDFCKSPIIGVETDTLVRSSLTFDKICQMAGTKKGVVELLKNCTNIEQEWAQDANKMGCAVGCFSDCNPAQIPQYTTDFKTFAEAKEFLNEMKHTPTTTWKIFIWEDTADYEPAEIAHIF